MTDGSANLKACLEMISECEGTAGPEGYQALFGYRPGNGQIFTDFRQHPNVRVKFTQTDGKVNWSTAAGKYQINFPTWNTEIQPALKLPDFSPESQDIAAAWLIAEEGAMDDLLAGRLQMAIDRLAGRWASLPSSRYLQPKRSYAYALNAFLRAGGNVG